MQTNMQFKGMTNLNITSNHMYATYNSLFDGQLEYNAGINFAKTLGLTM
jgi:hypothetical protein